jgi:hypothetical protein
MPYRAASAPVWKWFRLAKFVDYDKIKRSHSEKQQAFWKRSQMESNHYTHQWFTAAVLQEHHLYTAHTSKNHKYNEPTMLQKMKHDDVAVDHLQSGFQRK